METSQFITSALPSTQISPEADTIWPACKNGILRLLDRLNLYRTPRILHAECLPPLIVTGESR